MRRKDTGRLTDTKFPPKPMSIKGLHRIISNHCRLMRPNRFIEAGCAVCGCLVPKCLLTPLDKYE
ncbi:hypothetical protein B0H14DRAFT_2339822, partial [Mycena olivaceomarginata]